MAKNRNNKFFSFDNYLVAIPITFLVGSLAVALFLGMGLSGASAKDSFLVWLEVIILLGGWMAFLYGSVFILSDKVTENQLGLFLWTVGIGVLIGWLLIVLTIIAPALGLPIKG